MEQKWHHNKDKRDTSFIRILAWAIIILSVPWCVITFKEKLFEATAAIIIMMLMSAYALRLLLRNCISAAKVLILITVFSYVFAVGYFASGSGIEHNGIVHIWFIFFSILSYFLFYNFKPIVRDAIPVLSLALFFVFQFGLIPVHIIIALPPEEILFINKVTVLTFSIVIFFFTRYFVLEITQAEKTLAITADKLEESNEQLVEKNEAVIKAYDDLKKLESQLVQAEKMASLGQLTAGIAHEINNPINFVSANVKPLIRNYEEMLDFVLKKKEINEADLNYNIAESRQLMSGIEQGALRTKEIVKGLRNFSRLDEDDLKKADINEGLNSTLLLVQNLLNKKSIEVVKNYGNIPEIKCYPGQLNQVFMNVITNAIDAYDSSDLSDKMKVVTITTEQIDHSVKIRIRDNGKGMNEEVRKKVFDPFFTTKDVGKGTGLGLAISYGIIEKHGGKIEVSSEAGKGSEFVICLNVN